MIFFDVIIVSIMISLEEMRKILGEKGKRYTKEQLLKIRAFLIDLAHLNIKITKQKKER